jgi:hypothetical protein
VSLRSKNKNKNLPKKMKKKSERETARGNKEKRKRKKRQSFSPVFGTTSTSTINHSTRFYSSLPSHITI